MKTKTILILFFNLILTVCFLTQVHAVDDAEFEALEKQIEQLETDEKNQANAEAKKKTREEAKRKIEAEKKREEEQRLAEHWEKVEQNLLAEPDKTRQAMATERQRFEKEYEKIVQERLVELEKMDASSFRKLVEPGYKKSAEENFDIGLIIEYGIGGFPKNMQFARTYYKASASQGNVYAKERFERSR